MWTMAAICPNPLSPADEAYLTKLRDVVSYARDMRGMEVWPGECANNIAESDYGAPIEEREYFQVEALKNPGDPSQLAEIMDNRANMYRLIDNGDGYWIIDSDPGKWKGSPSDELGDIFAGNRALIDTYAERGSDAKLVYWIWQGWGTGSREENWRDTIQAISEKVHEPWWLDACNKAHLEVVSDIGCLEKTVYFPYGAIEHEPRNPLTHVRFEGLAEEFALSLRYPGLAGIMGNAQTPLAQLPNIFYFAKCAWNPDCSKIPSEEMLRELARFLLPAAQDELSEGWLTLDRPGSVQAFQVSHTLESLIAEGVVGAPGPGGRFIVPDAELIVRDLALLLKIHAYAEQIGESVKAAGDETAVQNALFGYLISILDWQAVTGFHGCCVNGVDFSGGGRLLHGRDFETVRQSLGSYFGKAGNEGKNYSWFRMMEMQLVNAGYGDFMSERAAAEGVLNITEE
jgi:hypothetical protein